MGTLDTPVPCELTLYGFTWGPTTVSRITTHHGTTLLELRTPREVMLLRMTPKGLIRVDVHKKVRK
jgi:hypothetical protein